MDKQALMEAIFEKISELPQADFLELDSQNQKITFDVGSQQTVIIDISVYDK